MMMIMTVFKATVTVRTHITKDIIFYCIFWTANSFATKLCLMVHHHEWEYLVKRLDCCVQGREHNEVSKLHYVFTNPIFSVQLIFLQSNNVYGCIITNNSKKCRQNGHILTVTLWLKLSPGTQQEACCHARQLFLFMYLLFRLQSYW